MKLNLELFARLTLQFRFLIVKKYFNNDVLSNKFF